MFDNENMLMTTLASKLKFATVEHIPIQTTDQISKSLNELIKLYVRSGFIINVILMDMEFDKVDE